MLNWMKAGLVALVVGGAGLAGLTSAQAATFVAGGPGGHVAMHMGVGPDWGDGWHHHHHWHHHQMICVTHWHHHHPVRVCHPIWG